MTETLSIKQDPVAAREAFERCIGAGGVAAFPADGLYGLACDPLDAGAVERIHSLKGREPGKPSAVMYFSVATMREIVAAMTPLVRAISAALLPGPVTLVIDNPERRYPLACGDTPDRLGVRYIRGPLEDAVHPVFQTSANAGGDPAPGSFEDVPVQIRAAVDVAIDGGVLSGEPSTVIDAAEVEAGGPWRILREGAMPYAEVEQKLTGLSLGG
ncbi:MAG: L-threonylcarbamoyladenylate synthase [Solirubrobacterales bacterium]